MARPIWNGTISFGLLNVPVQLHSGERSLDLHFRMLDSRDNSPVRYERVNSETGEEVPWKEIVKAFYEETPFPNYDDHDSLSSLIDKSRRGLYARRLDEAIPYNSAVLEVGCGTGQLSNFLGISCRRVVGADICMNSLKLGEAFRKEHGLARVRFVQMNLFRPVFKPEQFDVVLL